MIQFTPHNNHRVMSIVLTSFLWTSVLTLACNDNNKVCTSDASCEAGFVCINGTCQTKDPAVCSGTNCASSACQKDSDCPEGKTCQAGVCTTLPEKDPCSLDSDCWAGRHCDPDSSQCVDCYQSEHCDNPAFVCLANNTCGLEPVCRNDNDCEYLDKHCRRTTGTCEECVYNEHCPYGKICDATLYVCRAPEVSEYCTATSCEVYDQVCDETTHVCRDCANDPECGSGKNCELGKCVVSHTTDPETCNDSDDCDNGFVCHYGECVQCVNQAQCSLNYYCDASENICKEVECTEALQCPSGEGCREPGLCGPCYFSSECRTDERCNTISNVCEKIVDPNCTGNDDCSGGLVCVNGDCQECTLHSQCTEPLLCDTNQSPAICKDPSLLSDLELGSLCTADEQCQGGLCIAIGAKSYCSQVCIGSGKGHQGLAGHENADCPLGYHCYQGAAGSTLDGLKVCIKAEALSEGYPGQPFTSKPGEACSELDNHCQTSCSTLANSCRRLCNADRDCTSGEVCWAAYNHDGYHTGIQSCDVSITGAKLAGESCNNSIECNSGICAGNCVGFLGGEPYKLCHNNDQCRSLDSCEGVCVDHCRKNSDCPTGFICYPRPLDPIDDSAWDGDVWIMACTQAVFQDPNQTSCDGPNDCLSGICDNTGYCKNLENGQSCNADRNCQSEWCAPNGVCTTPCAIDADCTGEPAGAHCQLTKYRRSDDSLIYQIGLCLNKDAL